MEGFDWMESKHLFSRIMKAPLKFAYFLGACSIINVLVYIKKFYYT